MFSTTLRTRSVDVFFAAFGLVSGVVLSAYVSHSLQLAYRSVPLVQAEEWSSWSQFPTQFGNLVNNAVLATDGDEIVEAVGSDLALTHASYGRLKVRITQAQREPLRRAKPVLQVADTKKALAPLDVYLRLRQHFRTTVVSMPVQGSDGDLQVQSQSWGSKSLAAPVNTQWLDIHLESTHKTPKITRNSVSARAHVRDVVVTQLAHEVVSNERNIALQPLPPHKDEQAVTGEKKQRNTDATRQSHSYPTLSLTTATPNKTPIALTSEASTTTQKSRVVGPQADVQIRRAASQSAKSTQKDESNTCGYSLGIQDLQPGAIQDCVSSAETWSLEGDSSINVHQEADRETHPWWRVFQSGYPKVIAHAPRGQTLRVPSKNNLDLLRISLGTPQLSGLGSVMAKVSPGWDFYLDGRSAERAYLGPDLQILGPNDLRRAQWVIVFGVEPGSRVLSVRDMQKSGGRNEAVVLLPVEANTLTWVDVSEVKQTDLNGRVYEATDGDLSRPGISGITVSVAGVSNIFSVSDSKGNFKLSNLGRVRGFPLFLDTIHPRLSTQRHRVTDYEKVELSRVPERVLARWVRQLPNDGNTARAGALLGILPARVGSADITDFEAKAVDHTGTPAGRTWSISEDDLLGPSYQIDKFDPRSFTENLSSGDTVLQIVDSNSHEVKWSQMLFISPNVLTITDQ